MQGIMHGYIRIVDAVNFRVVDIFSQYNADMVAAGRQYRFT